MLTKTINIVTIRYKEEKYMSGINRTVSLIIIVLGLLGILFGAIFVYQGISKNNLIVDRMKVEKVAIALDPANPTQVTQVANADDAQRAADIISMHRRAISPTYQELLGTGKYDPTNQKHLTYAQAMNLENYLYMGVMAFGLVQVVLAAGVSMIISGAAIGLIGLMSFKASQKAA
jgi:hypothetical protein